MSDVLLFQLLCLLHVSCAVMDRVLYCNNDSSKRWEGTKKKGQIGYIQLLRCTCLTSWLPSGRCNYTDRCNIYKQLHLRWTDWSRGRQKTPAAAATEHVAANVRFNNDIDASGQARVKFLWQRRKKTPVIANCTDVLLSLYVTNLRPSRDQCLSLDNPWCSLG